MDYVRTELPKSICTFCHHPLSEHVASESNTESTTKRPLRTEHAQSTLLKNTIGQLSLKASASIALPVAIGNSTTTLQLPQSIEDCKGMSAIALRKAGDTKELALSLVTHEFRSLEAKSTQFSSDVTHQNDTGLQAESMLPDGGASQDNNSSTQLLDTDGKSRATKRGTKRRKSSESTLPVPPENQRRSLRIAEKKRRVEERAMEEEKRQKGKRGRSSKLEALLEARSRSEREIEEETMIKPLSEAQVKYLSGNAVEFVQSLCREESYRSCGNLPRVSVCLNCVIRWCLLNNSHG